MAIGTVIIAVTPSYATIGVAAPIIVVLGRLLQGFSAGVELGGVSVYLAEIATPGTKGFVTSFQSSSQQVAVFVGGADRLTRSARRSPPEAIIAWGWRIPFLIGCLIVPLIFVLRGSLQETPEFLAKKNHPTPPEIYRALLANLADRRARHADGDADDGLVLFHHGLYAGLRQVAQPFRRATRCW